MLACLPDMLPACLSAYANVPVHLMFKLLCRCRTPGERQGGWSRGWFLCLFHRDISRSGFFLCRVSVLALSCWRCVCVIELLCVAPCVWSCRVGSFLVTCPCPCPCMLTLHVRFWLSLRCFSCVILAIGLCSSHVSLSWPLHADSICETIWSELTFCMFDACVFDANLHSACFMLVCLIRTYFPHVWIWYVVHMPDTGMFDAGMRFACLILVCFWYVLFWFVVHMFDAGMFFACLILICLILVYFSHVWF